MVENQLTFPDQFNAQAYLVGERIDLRSFQKADSMAVSPLMVSVQGGGAAVLFRYGAVVFFSVAPIEQTTFLRQLKPMIPQGFENYEEESIQISIDVEKREGIDGNRITLKEFSVERLQLIADILGKSVALAYYEAALRRSFDLIEPFAINLEQNSRIGRDARHLLRHIGSAFLCEHKIAGRVEVGEKPDLLWSHPQLEGLYLHLEDEFEIKERNLVLERKLNLINHTAQTILGIIQDRRTLRVEWYIVILIVVEILLTLYEMIFYAH